MWFSCYWRSIEDVWRTLQCDTTDCRSSFSCIVTCGRGMFDLKLWDADYKLEHPWAVNVCMHGGGKKNVPPRNPGCRGDSGPSFWRQDGRKFCTPLLYRWHYHRRSRCGVLRSSFFLVDFCMEHHTSISAWRSPQLSVSSFLFAHFDSAIVLFFFVFFSSRVASWRKNGPPCGFFYFFILFSKI